MSDHEIRPGEDEQLAPVLPFGTRTHARHPSTHVMTWRRDEPSHAICEVCTRPVSKGQQYVVVLRGDIARSGLRHVGCRT